MKRETQRESLDYMNLWIWLASAAGGERAPADERLREHLRTREADGAAVDEASSSGAGSAHGVLDWYATLARFLLGELDQEALLDAALGAAESVAKRGPVAVASGCRC